MKVEVDYELKRKSKARKMSPTTLIFVMVVMLFVGAGVYIAVDAARPQTIDAARAEEFRQISRRFYLNKNGVEIPIKFVSGTEIAKEKEFFASIFIKFPIDLIDNRTFVGRIIDLIADEIEDGFDRESNGEKIAHAEFKQPARKAFEDIIEVVYLVEFTNGSSTFTDFVMPIVNQFETTAEEYYKLLHQFRQYGFFVKDRYEEYETVSESEEDEEFENIKIHPKVSLIEKLRN